MEIKLHPIDPTSTPKEAMELVWEEVWDRVFRWRNIAQWIPRFREYMSWQPGYKCEPTEEELVFYFSTFSGLLAFTADVIEEYFVYFLSISWPVVEKKLLQIGYGAELLPAPPIRELLLRNPTPYLITRGRLWSIRSNDKITLHGDDGEKLEDLSAEEESRALKHFQEKTSDNPLYHLLLWHSEIDAALPSGFEAFVEEELIEWSQREPDRDDILRLFVEQEAPTQKSLDYLFGLIEKRSFKEALTPWQVIAFPLEIDHIDEEFLLKCFASHHPLVRAAAIDLASVCEDRLRAQSKLEDLLMPLFLDKHPLVRARLYYALGMMTWKYTHEKGLKVRNICASGIIKESHPEALRASFFAAANLANAGYLRKDKCIEVIEEEHKNTPFPTLREAADYLITGLKTKRPIKQKLFQENTIFEIHNDNPNDSEYEFTYKFDEKSVTKLDGEFIGDASVKNEKITIQVKERDLSFKELADLYATIHFTNQSSLFNRARFLFFDEIQAFASQEVLWSFGFETWLQRDDREIHISKDFYPHHFDNTEIDLGVYKEKYEQESLDKYILYTDGRANGIHIKAVEHRRLRAILFSLPAFAFLAPQITHSLFQIFNAPAGGVFYTINHVSLALFCFGAFWSALAIPSFWLDSRGLWHLPKLGSPKLQPWSSFIASKPEETAENFTELIKKRYPINIGLEEHKATADIYYRTFYGESIRHTVIDLQQSFTSTPNLKYRRFLVLFFLPVFLISLLSAVILQHVS